MRKPVDLDNGLFACQTVVIISGTIMGQEGLVWQSLKWQDGTMYNGLTKGGMMHSHGVLTFPNKDRYEGEFEDGRMQGSGVYVWHTGMIYRGDWSQGMMHGCGTRLWKQPDGSMAVSEGKFFGDEFVGDVMPCGKEDGFDSAVDADMAALQARSFQQWSGRHQSKSQLQRPTAARQQQPSGQLTWQKDGRIDDNTVGHSGLADTQQEQKLQNVLQRLVADRMAAPKGTL